jgi:hypothetical protein
MIAVNGVCGKCGAKISGDTSQGVCPACLLQAGLGSLADESVADVAYSGRDAGGRPVDTKRAARPARMRKGGFDATSTRAYQLGRLSYAEDIGRPPLGTPSARPGVARPTENTQNRRLPQNTRASLAFAAASTNGSAS